MRSLLNQIYAGPRKGVREMLADLGITIPRASENDRIKALRSITKADDSVYQVRNIQEGVDEILIYDEIDSFWGIDPQMILEDLDRLRNNTIITVRINSPGGNVFDSLAIYNALVRHKAEIQIAIDGMALSAAVNPVMAGNVIAMAENAMLMIHKPWRMAVGNDDELRDAADTLTAVGASMAKIYADANRKDLTPEGAMEIMSGNVDGTWYTANEALDLGIIDEITENLQIAARFDPNRFRDVPAEFMDRAMGKDEARHTEARKKLGSMADWSP